MDKYGQFYKYIQEKADEFRKTSGNEAIRIISHLDADGISSCSILIRAMTRANRQHSVSVVQQADEKLLKKLSGEPYKTIAFTDLGSGQLSMLKELLPGKKICILDHHELETEENSAKENDENLIHINPHIFGIDGSREVSGAGVTYLFAKALDEKNKDMANIAIIGAIGDVQAGSGFEKINADILNDAVESGKLKIIPGIKVFGAQTKPLHRLLAYSSEYPIPGVTGSESGAIQFINQIGIDIKKGDKWKKLVDLDDEEMKKLVAGIIIRRLGEENPEAIIGPVYILREEAKQSPLRDAKEFSTLLNACGRMSKAALGIGACLGDKKLKAKAVEHMAEYRKEIMKAMNWFEESLRENRVIKGENYLIINAGKKVPHTMIGTLASIVSKSDYLKQGTIVMSMAEMDENNTKVSLRMCGNTNHDMKALISKIAGAVDGTAGGHTSAAGAVIKTEMEQQFVESAKDIFEKL